MITPYSRSLPRPLSPQDQRAGPLNCASPAEPGCGLGGRGERAGWAGRKGWVGGEKERARAAPSDRSPSRWPRDQPPLSTGCPDPFHAQPPVQPDQRRRPPPAGPASEPGAGLSSNIPPIAVMSTANAGFPYHSEQAFGYFQYSLGEMFTACPGRAPPYPGPPAPVCLFCPVGGAFLSQDRENLRPLPSCRPAIRGMDHPTWRHVILCAPASAADAVLPSGGDANG